MIRFRLSSCLLVFALIAVGMGWWLDATRREAVYYLHIFRVTSLEPKTHNAVASIRLTANRPFAFKSNDLGFAISGNLASDTQGNLTLKFSAQGTPISFNGPIEVGTTFSPIEFVGGGSVMLHECVISTDAELDREKLKAEPIAE